jgi:hypothetical protein
MVRHTAAADMREELTVQVGKQAPAHERVHWPRAVLLMAVLSALCWLPVFAVVRLISH